ncbi:SCA7, zinc-binding domain-domain-containing protein [Kockovaella imperatae]|uniref:SCA7, zinc-binding domain-domain-containing protein n=1 Tax=Kockovaella imperatae TaxID=4999 RepID=A0A1Y1UN11_9TREE|nr:SCA7, zinc-binding domain-domain-containing protein [Kockovaella imperatae]ORX39441.1 SCA7, zinc-binding domain-domain-containing protein [Kockovaella imperatae]
MTLSLKPRESLPPFTFSTASSPSNVSSAPRPPADFIPERDMNLFGAYPQAGSSESGRGLVVCPRCDKAVLELALGDHKRICSHILDGTPLTIKKSIKRARRASDLSSSESPSKKRAKLPVSDDEDDEAPLVKGVKKVQMKKIQKEQAKLERKAAKEREKIAVAERKRMRGNGPVDLDRQCGVINDKNLPCSRSLTCKTHTVGAKRAVEGRSRSYDDLYLEWQRNNNPNFKEPAPKKEREARRAEKKERDRAIADENKRKRGTTWVDDDGLGDGEDGKREMEELVHVTRLAGQRVCPRIHGSVWISIVGSSGTATKRGLGGGYEIAQVGDMLTKALAARPKPPSLIAKIPAKVMPGTMGIQQFPVAAV